MHCHQSPYPLAAHAVQEGDDVATQKTTESDHETSFTIIKYFTPPIRCSLIKLDLIVAVRNEVNNDVHTHPNHSLTVLSCRGLVVWHQAHPSKGQDMV